MQHHKIILVDDHKIVRDGIKAMLIGDSTFSVVGEAGESKRLYEILETVAADLVVLDLKLPGESGLDIAENLRSKKPGLRILLLTAEASESIVRQCIRIGVEGIISKESGREVYIEALYAIGDGRTYYGGQFMGLLAGAASQKKEIKLSDRELDVLKGFAKGLSYKEIAAVLDISPRTVETHKNNIQEKLGVTTTADLVKYALKEGIVR
jgi:DNA-binding NarL/FixJ family response regulator